MSAIIIIVSITRTGQLPSVNGFKLSIC